MSATTQRIGLLTGGGDCPGLHAVIRAAAARQQQVPLDSDLVRAAPGLTRCAGNSRQVGYDD